jgi:hypothetical protein
MAQKNVGIPGQKLTEYEQIKVAEMHKQQEELVYCKLCGSPILRTRDPETPWQLENKVHVGCAREYQEREDAKIAARIQAQRKLKQ